MSLSTIARNAASTLDVDCFQLPVARYRFVLRARTHAVLPPYLGSTLRGAFGHAFRALACATHRPTCDGCQLRGDCVYPRTFEPTPPPDADRLRNLSNIPRPFVLEPPPWGSSERVAEGDELSWSLTLFGNDHESLPWFITTVRRMAEVGLGADRARGAGRFALEQVSYLSPHGCDVPLYDPRSGTVKRSPPPVPVSDWKRPQDPVSRVRIHFLTPFRAQQQGRIVTTFHPYVLIRSILSRVSTLTFFYDRGRTLDVAFRSLLDSTASIRVAEDHTRWEDWARWSSRQDRRMAFGGLMGSVVLEGDPAPFLPWLLAGQVLHVGKNVTFGLGRYEVRVP